MAEQTSPRTTGTSPGATQMARDFTGTRPNSFASRVREQAANQLNTQKNRATDGLGSVVNAVRGTTQRLRDEKHDTMARYVDQAANQLERLSNGLKHRDVNDLMRGAQQFAQRRPVLFVGSAFAAGLLSARFMKSSSQRDGRAREAEYRVDDTSRGAARTPGTAGGGGGGTPIQGSGTPGERRTRAAAVTSRDTDYPSTEGM